MIGQEIVASEANWLSKAIKEAIPIALQSAAQRLAPQAKTTVVVQSPMPGTLTITPWYKKPVVIVGGVSLIVIALYFILKKRK